MERTLFTPPMIETFRVCRRAYQLAFLASREQRSEKMRLSTICKRFLLKALAEVNRSRITNVPQMQKYLGQQWPAEGLAAPDDATGQEKTIQAFRFLYRVLTNYVVAPYRPQGSEVAAVSLKVRARVPHTKVYLEDTFDLILWHPEQKILELVDFHIQPLKPFDPAWPTPSLLVRHFLAQRLRSRWPFEKILFTFCHLRADGFAAGSLELDESVVNLHWPDLVKTVNQMQSEEDFSPHRSELCKRCQFLGECLAMGPAASSGDGAAQVCMSA
jgi:hypothetical protein